MCGQTYMNAAGFKPLLHLDGRLPQPSIEVLLCGKKETSN